MNILITGCEGLLGRYIYENYQYGNNIIRSNRKICDLYYKDRIYNTYSDQDIDTIIHCAAYTDVKKSNTDLKKVFKDNICSSVNLIDFAYSKNIRFVFISTDFVFDGTKGFYKTYDLINPQSVYAKSKASIELALSTYSNSLIIRTSFYGESFPFDIGYNNRFTSKDYIDIIAPKIYQESVGKRTGILHIGTERKTYYELGKRRKNIDEVSYQDNTSIGKDYSFDYENN